ncbi:hypothetical protein [Flavobacterium hydatis]|uniref:Knr4/Smi1-like domain-containing protein n=1 Tax=Flavobacterium hydatis TaxID=991 RepID=A0A086AAD6_FLAHY|nr:hypothetical protein [Flavobacterium hydatis]KFF13650.1 hypothetical protein IW20_17700 [Flavobacterium hydatis]OXA90304.1 hypothetical protein B0A62_19730 [Flavobacterium hydatis]
MIKQTAEKLLGRSLTNNDGFEVKIIENAETRLGQEIPKLLKEFYITVGKLDIFMSSFQRFIKPEDLFYEDDKLVFLEENQKVCFWGVDKENKEDNLLVYQVQNIDNAVWYSEEILLSDFLQMIMYGQCAEGGYTFSGAIYDMDKDELSEFIEEITTKNWQKVVDHNNWIIYENDRKLIWYFTDEDGNLSEDYPLFVSTQTKEDFLETEEEFGFSDLD